MLPQIWKRLGTVMTPCDFFLFILLLFIIIKFLVESGKYYNVYSDINVKTVQKYAVTFTLIGLD